LTGADLTAHVLQRHPGRLVVIKPQFCDISTNVLIPTDRRIYELLLVQGSPNCSARSSKAHMTGISSELDDRLT
jgi:hypothetical protein